MHDYKWSLGRWVHVHMHNYYLSGNRTACRLEPELPLSLHVLCKSSMSSARNVPTYISFSLVPTRNNLAAHCAKEWNTGYWLNAFIFLRPRFVELGVIAGQLRCRLGYLVTSLYLSMPHRLNCLWYPWLSWMVVVAPQSRSGFLPRFLHWCPCP